ncbi:MAG: hypothetical protein JNM56_00245 [Planctomycetia bacterium]|nr:hypothetical protein [Planctomycetia bacterium]
MNAKGELKPAGIAGWQLEFARLVAFPIDPPLFLKQTWWHELVGAEPDDFVSIRRKQSQEVRGSSQGSVLSLNVDLQRITWTVQAADAPDGAAAKLPTLGTYPEKVPLFAEQLGSWLASSCPPLRRLAFGGKLLRVVGSQQEAYQFLSSFLPRIEFEPNPNDFVLQINRRRVSRSVQGLQLNRVSTWSKMNVAIVAEPGTPFQWPEECYSALELDINTAPERLEGLPPQSLVHLFQELTELGGEIADRGDVP